MWIVGWIPQAGSKRLRFLRSQLMLVPLRLSVPFQFADPGFICKIAFP